MPANVSILKPLVTHEQRPLLMLTFAAPQRLADIEQVRSQHLARLEGEPSTNDDPAVVYMGYSVHGNESSGSNAALLVAYYLARTTQDQRVEKLLNDTVVLLDPSLNPDGLARFANWANSNRAMTPSADSSHANTMKTGRVVALTIIGLI